MLIFHSLVVTKIKGNAILKLPKAELLRTQIRINSFSRNTLFSSGNALLTPFKLLMQAVLKVSSTAEQIGTNLLFSGTRPNQAGKPFLAPLEIVDAWRCWSMDFLLI
jgi:hypothetical protein